MDCELELRDDGLWHCKADCGRAPYPKKVRQRCGFQPDPQKPPRHTCGQEMVRKKRLPEGKVWWRCESCRVFVRECIGCNAKLAAKQPSLIDLASEHDAVD